MVMKIGEAISSGLRRKKISQRDLAYFLGVTPSAISNWIAGRNHPEAEQLIKIIDYLDIVSDIFPNYIKVKNQAQNSPYISASLEGGKTDLEGENVPDLEARAEIANLRLNDEKTHEEIAKLKGDFGTMMSDFSSLRMDIEKMMAMLGAKKK